MIIRRAAAATLLALAAGSAPALDTKQPEWPPVDPAELALSAPTIEKDADAEALVSEEHIDQHQFANAEEDRRRHYRRVKIFTAKGVESQGHVDLPFEDGFRVTEVSGRTILPDRTILPMPPAAIAQHDVKRRGRTMAATSFTLPGVVPGAIIEYRWEAVRRGRSVFFSLPLQLDIPVHRLSYVLHPYAGHSYTPTGLGGVLSAVLHPVNATLPEIVRDKAGFNTITLLNRPSFRTEPFMPPAAQVRSALYVVYTDHPEETSHDFWRRFGRDLYDDHKGDIDPNGAIRDQARQINAGATSDGEKLERLYRFCQGGIKRSEDDAATFSLEDRRKASEHHGGQDTLERRVGSDFGITALFAALARAAGFDARLAAASGRRYSVFDEDLHSSRNMQQRLVAVMQDGAWRLFDPGGKYVTPGMLSWWNEGVKIAITDPANPTFVVSPLSSPDKSTTRRRGTFRLDENGALEGDVRIEYSGHAAVTEKDRYDALSADERSETLDRVVHGHVPAAEISNLRFTGVTDPESALIVEYHLRVPAFAERTGRRLFLEPAVFQHGTLSLFPSAERRYPVQFQYAWAEDDEATIQWPEGFLLDHADAPAPISAAPVASYELRIASTAASRALVSRRTFSFGGEGQIAFPVERYAIIKAFFDGVRERDHHGLTLVKEERP